MEVGFETLYDRPTPIDLAESGHEARNKIPTQARNSTQKRMLEPRDIRSLASTSR